jgi:ribosomal protein S26
VLVIELDPGTGFAALRLIELGFKANSGRKREKTGRRRDLKAINVDHVVNEDSNYCFGEGKERILTGNIRDLKKGEM